MTWEGFPKWVTWEHAPPKMEQAGCHVTFWDRAVVQVGTESAKTVRQVRDHPWKTNSF